jgi:hypothetical protein
MGKRRRARLMRQRYGRNRTPIVRIRYKLVARAGCEFLDIVEEPVD